MFYGVVIAPGCLSRGEYILLPNGFTDDEVRTGVFGFGLILLLFFSPLLRCAVKASNAMVKV